jgi:toxin-antitoxin system PIN domain toxin
VRALLDVNVLIALLDADHASHAAAMSWFKDHAAEGWASCAITQNGCIRIMSNPSYPQPLLVQAIVKRLANACREQVHRFWAEEVSILDSRFVDVTRIHGPRQLTDIYLLALSVRNEGRFVTFDSTIPLAAVKHAQPQNLLVL